MLNHMVEFSEHQIDTVFQALSDATRRQMLMTLAASEQTVGQLAAPYAMSLAAASKHIKVLETAGLVRREIQGRTHLCRLSPGPLAAAHEWLAFYERFWTAGLDTLDRLLREDDAIKTTGPQGEATTKAEGKPHSKPGDDQ
jgi:DNA-binding transcriptional ArsR family regulator